MHLYIIKYKNIIHKKYISRYKQNNMVKVLEANQMLIGRFSLVYCLI